MSTTCIPSISHLSPTSNGCMTNKKMIASNMVLQVFPKMNATTTIWELTKTKNLLEAIPSTISHKIDIRMPNITFTIWCSLSTAVLVSFSVKARALRSLKALTWKRRMYHNVKTWEVKILKHQTWNRKYSTPDKEESLSEIGMIMIHGWHLDHFEA